MAIRIPPDSRYVFSDLLQETDDRGLPVNRFMWGSWVGPVIEESADDSFFTVSAPFVGRLDRVAQASYNNPSLWWVIAYVNGIPDQRLLSVGTVLRVPPYSKVVEVLLNAS